MTNDLFNAGEIPFNLAGELLDLGLDQEGQARKDAQAEADARKAQIWYDYDRQAWIVNGRVDKCGHPYFIPGCYACNHAGEKAERNEHCH